MDERPILTPFVATEANKDFEDFRRALVGKVRKSVESGNEAEVKKWLSAHSVDEDLGGSTLLHMACASGRASIARMLLKKGASVEVKDERGWTPLHCAAFAQEFKLCDVLITKYKADVHVVTGQGCTVATYVCKAGSVMGTSYSVAYQMRLLKLLAEMKFDFALANEHGESPLHFACLTGTPEVVEFLLQQSINVNAVTDEGESALHFAVRSNKEHILHVLFRFGANVLLQNKAGLTPCGIAEEMGLSHLVVLLKEYERNLTSRLSRMSIRIEGKDRPSPRSAGKLRKPFMRYGYCATVVNHSLMVFGGTTHEDWHNPMCGFLNDAWLYDMSKAKWRQIKLHPTPPPLSGAVAVALKERVFIFGGCTAVGVQNPHVYLVDVGARRCVRAESDMQLMSKSASSMDLLKRQISGDTVSEYAVAKVSGSTSPRAEPSGDGLDGTVRSVKESEDVGTLLHHTATVVSMAKTMTMKKERKKSLETHRVVVYGSGLQEHQFASLFDPSRMTWEVVVKGDPVRPGVSAEDGAKGDSAWPTARYGHSATLVSGDIFVFGGTDGTACTNELVAFNVAQRVWRRISTTGRAPPPRAYHSAGLLGSIMVVMGGRDHSGNELRDVFALDLRSSMWYPCPLAAPCLPAVNSFYLHSAEHNLVLLDISDATVRTLDAGLFDQRHTNTIVETVVDHALKTPIKRAPSNKQIDSPKQPPRRTTSDKRVSHREMKERADRVESVELFANTLATHSLRLIDLVMQELDSDAPMQDEERLAELRDKCEEIQAYCVMNKPKKSWAAPTDRSSSPKAEKDALGLVRGIRSRLIEGGGVKLVPYPTAHYYALPLPPPWDEQSSEAAEDKEHPLWQRQAIARELLRTETAYVLDLAIVVGLYKKPLENEFAGLVEPYPLKLLFSNVETLLSLNVQLLGLLRIETDKPPEQQRQGRVFLSMMKEFLKYNAYSLNTQRSIETLDSLLKNNHSFGALCDVVKRMEQCKQIDLGGYLMKPFQRICRYQLLLKELLKHTPEDWEDAATLAQAIDGMDDIVRNANETKRLTDNCLKIMEIQGRFKEICEVDLGKQYVDEAAVKRVERGKPKRFFVFLFSDLVIFGRPNKSGKLSKCEVMSREHVHLLPTADPFSKLGRNGATFVHAEPEQPLFRYQVFFNSAEDRIRWLGLLEKPAGLEVLGECSLGSGEIGERKGSTISENGGEQLSAVSPKKRRKSGARLLGGSKRKDSGSSTGSSGSAPSSFIIMRTDEPAATANGIDADYSATVVVERAEDGDAEGGESDLGASG